MGDGFDSWPATFGLLINFLSFSSGVLEVTFFSLSPSGIWRKGQRNEGAFEDEGG